MTPVLVKRGVAEKSSCATSGVFSCSLLMTAFHSLPSSCVWWASSLMTSSCPAAGDALGEIDLLYLLGRRPRAQNGRHHIWLILLRAIWPFVKLLDIG